MYKGITYQYFWGVGGYIICAIRDDDENFALEDSAIAQYINIDLEEYRKIVNSYSGRQKEYGANVSIFKNEEKIKELMVLFKLMGTPIY